MASDLRYLLGGLREDIARLEWQPATAQTIETAGQGQMVRY